MSSNNTYFSLATLKASSVAEGTAFLVQVPAVEDGAFFWTLGDFTGQADDKNIIKADSTALSIGAWVRQKARGVNFDGRSTDERLREAFSVADTRFAGGAKGNGDTDDTAALQMAFNYVATAGALLNFVAGKTYLVSAELVVPSGLRLRGRGARILVKANAKIGLDNATYAPGGAVLHSYDAVGVEIEGLEIDCNGDNAGAMFGIYIRQGSDASVRNCHIHDSRATGILFDGVSDGSITENRVINCGRPTTLSGGTSSQDHGITVQAIDAIDCVGTIVNGNRVIGASRKGITCYSQNTGTVRDTSISNNVVRHCALGGIFIGSGASATPQESITVTGNNCSNSYVDIEIARLASGSVTGNSSKNSVFAGIVIDSSSNVVFSGNSINGAGTHGIAASSCDHIAVSANIITQAGRVTPGYAAGIRLISVVGSSITSNRVSDSNSGMTHGIIEENAGCNNNFIAGNLVTDASAAAYVVKGAGTVLQSEAMMQTAGGYNVGVHRVVGERGAAVANAVDAASTTARLNELLARLRTHGLIAS